MKKTWQKKDPLQDQFLVDDCEENLWNNSVFFLFRSSLWLHEDDNAEYNSVLYLFELNSSTALNGLKM